MAARALADRSAIDDDGVDELLSRDARRLLAVLARRWSLPILEALAAGALRHNEIRSAVSGVADKVLVETLRVLEAESLVTRTVYAEVPLRVEYRLTDAGEALPAALHPLNEWAALCRRQSCAQQ